MLVTVLVVHLERSLHYLLEFGQTHNVVSTMSFVDTAYAAYSFVVAFLLDTEELYCLLTMLFAFMFFPPRAFSNHDCDTIL